VEAEAAENVAFLPRPPPGGTRESGALSQAEETVCNEGTKTDLINKLI
jgi:hypothetical protein